MALLTIAHMYVYPFAFNASLFIAFGYSSRLSLVVAMVVLELVEVEVVPLLPHPLHLVVRQLLVRPHPTMVVVGVEEEIVVSKLVEVVLLLPLPLYLVICQLLVRPHPTTVVVGVKEELVVLKLVEVVLLLPLQLFLEIPQLLYRPHPTTAVVEEEEEEDKVVAHWYIFSLVLISGINAYLFFLSNVNFDSLTCISLAYDGSMQLYLSFRFIVVVL